MGNANIAEEVPKYQRGRTCEETEVVTKRSRNYAEHRSKNEKRKENPKKKFGGRNQPNPMDPLTNLAKLFILGYAESEVCQLLGKIWI